MYQKTTILGNLGGKPTSKYTPDGMAVTNFSVAVNERVKNETKTIWFRVTVFGKQAEACYQYLDKGSKVLVEGRLDFENETGSPKVWQDATGNSRASFELISNRVVFASPVQNGHDDYDDVPF